MEGLVSRHKKMLHIRVMGVQKLLPKRFISPGFEVISVGSNRGEERDNLYGYKDLYDCIFDVNIVTTFWLIYHDSEFMKILFDSGNIL